MNIDKYITEIKEQLKLQGYSGKKINYPEFISLYKTYGNQMAEKEFAQNVLEMTYDQYDSLKRRKDRAIILKKQLAQIIQQDIDEIKKRLIFDGYCGKLIDYTEIQMLHKMYAKQIPEDKFAKLILELNETSYRQVRSGKRKVYILKRFQNKTQEDIEQIFQKSQEEIKEIKEILKSLGYVGKLINYTELQELHQQYGIKMPEHKFAQEVLEISASLYGNIKYNSAKKAAVLKGLIDEPSQEDIENMQRKLENMEMAGRLINYEELKRLHREYGSQVREEFFAQQVLEIPSYLYKDMKHSEYKTQILCHNPKVELINSILLKESRWYTKEELEQICMENGVTIDKIIRQIISNGTNRYNDYYKKVLQEKGKIWIGRTTISEGFLERNIDIIVKLAKTALYSVKKRYNISRNSEDEDLIQEAIIWLVQNGGEIEKNFADCPQVMERKLFNTIRKGITIKILVSLETTIKTVSLNKRTKIGRGAEKELQSRIAIPYDLEAVAIERIDDENEDDMTKYLESKIEIAIKCVQEMKNQIEIGLDRYTVLNNVRTMFWLSKAELLEIMQIYLLENGSVNVEKGNLAECFEEK